jgi:DNA-binding transcriptional ArsR family regulator
MKTTPTWWVTAEDHRFALEVLQLGLRRKMLMAVARSCMILSQIEMEFDLSPAQAEYHLRMLEKALVVEETADGWIATPTGILYLEKVETKR